MNLDTTSATHSAAENDLAPPPLASQGQEASALSIAPKPEKFVPLNLDKRNKTIGEKIHWALTYIGGDWLLNSAIGVTFTFVTARTAFGQKYYVEPANKLFEKIAGAFTKDPKTIEKAASGGRDFLSIMMGGTLINPILTRLENHHNKKRISKFFDTLFHGKEAVAEDPKFQQAYDAIDQEPVKDTKSVWISRGIAIAPLWAATFSPPIMKFLKSNDVPLLKYINFDHISKFTRNAAETIGIKPKKMLERTMKNATTGEHISDWEALHGYAGFDYGLTIFYALLHAAAFAAVAKWRADSKQHHAEKMMQVADLSMDKAAPAAAPATDQPDQPASSEKPSLKISHVAHREPVMAEQLIAPQLS